MSSIRPSPQWLTLAQLLQASFRGTDRFLFPSDFCSSSVVRGLPDFVVKTNEQLDHSSAPELLSPSVQGVHLVTLSQQHGFATVLLDLGSDSIGVGPDIFSQTHQATRGKA